MRNGRHNRRAPTPPDRGPHSPSDVLLTPQPTTARGKSVVLPTPARPVLSPVHLRLGLSTGVVVGLVDVSGGAYTRTSVRHKVDVTARGGQHMSAETVALPSRPGPVESAQVAHDTVQAPRRDRTRPPTHPGAAGRRGRGRRARPPGMRAATPSGRRGLRQRDALLWMDGLSTVDSGKESGVPRCSSSSATDAERSGPQRPAGPR